MPLNRISAPGTLPGARRLSLRLVLVVVVFAMAAYVIGFSGIVAYRIVPPTAEVLDRSHTTAAAWLTRIEVDSAFRTIRSRADRVLRSAYERRVPDPAQVRSAVLAMREAAQGTWIVDLERALRRADDERALAHASEARRTHEAMVAALREAADDMERGQYGFAGRALARADSFQLLTTARILGIEDPAFMGLFRGERTVVKAAQAARRLVWWWALGAGLLVGGIAFAGHRWLYRPLHDLEEGLRRVAAGEFGRRLDLPRFEETARLTDLYNAMSQVLADRAAEEERRAGNLAERLGRLVDESANEIYVIDAGTLRIRQANRGALRNLGLSLEQLAARTVAELLPEFTEASLAEVLRPLQEGAQAAVHVQTLQRRGDGSLYPVEMLVHLSHNEDPPVFLAVATDVSARVHMEVELERVFELSGDVLMALRTDGTVLRANPATARVVGVPTERLAGSSLYDLAHPDDRALVADAIRRLLGGGTVRDLRIRTVNALGEPRLLSWNCDPPVEGMLYPVGRDVTSEAEIAEQERVLKAAVERVAREWSQTFDAIEEPVVIVDATSRVLRLNESARALVAGRHVDLLFRPLRDLGTDPLWSRAADIADEAHRRNSRVGAQVRSGRPERIWDVGATPVRLGGGSLAGAVVVAHDVTSVVSMQEAIRRSETMAALGSLVAGVAHEVRNPLFSMTATLDAFEARSPESARGPHLEVLRAQLHRLTLLMQDLLDYGRPQAVELAPESLAAVFAEAEAATRQQAEAKGVRVETGEDPALTRIVADRRAIAQVVINLVSNAIAFTPQGGTVHVRASAIQEDSRDWVETVVQDGGPGFPPEDLPNVFEPFFTRRKGGTGLGLAIVRRVVEQHGGRVEAGNAPEGGGRVRVLLPAAAG